MPKFAKIIEVGDEQLLITKDWDEDAPTINISTEVKDIGQYIETWTFITTEARDKCFNEVDDVYAANFVETANNHPMFKGQEDDENVENTN